jgi:nitroreductase
MLAPTRPAFACLRCHLTARRYSRTREKERPVSNETDPIASIAGSAIEHMNGDHAEALLAYARGLAGMRWAERATVSGIDAAGVELLVVGAGRSERARVAFVQPLTDPEQLRPALVALAQRARAASPPQIVSSPPPERDEHMAARLLNTIATRRSFGLKEVAPEPIDLALVERLLEAANWAPSHGKTEPWRFVVYSGGARGVVGDAFGAAFRLLNPAQAPGGAGEQAQRDRVWQAPVWIALGMRPDPKMPEWEELIAFGSAVQNMHLMAGALGLAAKWTSGACAVHPHVAEAVGFAPDTRLLGFFYVGLPAVPWPEGKRRPLAPKVRWVGEGAVERR